MRDAARLGSAAAVRRRAAAAQAAFFTLLIKGQLRAIRSRRAVRESDARLLPDLALYRRQRRRWRRIARLLARQSGAWEEKKRNF